MKEIGEHGESIWKLIKWGHMRIQPNAYLVNRRFKCKGDPDTNRFGHSVLITEEDAKQGLEGDFWQTIDKFNPTRYLPIVIVGHDLGNDLRLLDRVIDFKGGELGVVVAEIDTQVMAWELKYQLSNNKIGLKKLVIDLSMTYKDPHTVTNDIVMTIAATLMVLPPTLNS